MNSFRAIIDSKLLSLVDRDYVFLDLPYHGNIGDSFIYAGVMDFLSSTGHKCLYKSSEHTFDRRTISLDTLIVFNGGGNFGDMWPDCTEFRNRIISQYPDHKYIIFPQSVYYRSTDNLERDKALYARCTNMTICARDQESYDFLSLHFRQNRILLVPDMAFHLPEKLLMTGKVHTGKSLFIKRNDREMVSELFVDNVPLDTEVKDWPTIDCREGWPYVMWKYYRKLVGLYDRIGLNRVALHLTDSYWQKVLIPYNIQTGIQLIGVYDTIYTTRLHAAIAGVILGKRVVAFDNVYGKLSSYVNTWMKDCPSINVIYNEASIG